MNVIKHARLTSKAPLPVLTRSYGERGWVKGNSGVDAQSLSGRKPTFDFEHGLVIDRRFDFF